MSYPRFEIPVNDGHGRQIECDVRHHEKPELTCPRKDRPENQTDEGSLFNPGQALVAVVCKSEPCRAEQNDRYRRSGASPKQFAQALESKTAKNGLLAETGADDDKQEHG